MCSSAERIAAIPERRGEKRREQDRRGTRECRQTEAAAGEHREVGRRTIGGSEEQEDGSQEERKKKCLALDVARLQDKGRMRRAHQAGGERQTAAAKDARGKSGEKRSRERARRDGSHFCPHHSVRPA